MATEVGRVEEVYVRPPSKPSDIPLRIYSNPICPYAQRARLIASFKKVKHEVIEVNLKKKPNWFLTDINPFGLVPVIEHNGHIIRESAVVFDYIDEVFDGIKLWPGDPYKRAQTRIIISDFGSQFTSNYYKYFFDKADETTAGKILTFLKTVEDVLSQYGGPFIFGKDITAVDLMIWPWFERARAFADKVKGFSDWYTPDKLPTLIKWVDHMLTVDEIKNMAMSPDDHNKFLQTVQNSGNTTHNYSMADPVGKGLKIYSTEKTD